MDTGFATRVVQNKRHVLRVGIGGDAAPTAILSGMTMMTGLADFYGLRAHCFCYRIKKNTPAGGVPVGDPWYPRLVEIHAAD